MKRDYLLLTLLLVSLAWCSCTRKEDPEFMLVANAPLFYTTGLIDGQQVKLQAGVNGYTQQYTYQHNGAYYQFRSVLKSAGTEQLTIGFNDSSLIANGGPSAIMQHLVPGKDLKFAYGSSVMINAGRVVVSWVNENGRLFTSEKYQQPASSYFQILDTNRVNAGKAVKPEFVERIHVSFKCRLYSAVNDSMDILLVSQAAILPN